MAYAYCCSMDSFTEFPTFVWAVLHYWAAVVTGGVFALVLAVIEHKRGQISWGRYVLILALSVFVACYFAWREENLRRTRAECTIAIATERSNAKRKLADFYTHADDYIFGSAPPSSSPEDLSKWAQSTNEWYATVQVWVSENLGEAALAQLRDLVPQGPTLSWSRAVSPQHNAIINNMMKIKQNIGVLMSSSAWDDFTQRAKTAAGCQNN